jgi:hypothetical protein
MCRAATVLCVAPDADRLRDLKQAVVAADWELSPGATDLRAALDQIDVYRPQSLVVVGPFEELVTMVADRFPGGAADAAPPGWPGGVSAVSRPRGPTRSVSPCASSR